MTQTIPRVGTGQAVASKIRALMGEHRVSGYELARRMHWQESMVRRRISGRTPMSVDDLTAFAEALGVDVTDLLPRTASP